MSREEADTLPLHSPSTYPPSQVPPPPPKRLMELVDLTVNVSGTVPKRPLTTAKETPTRELLTSKEFKFYYLFAIVVIPIMIWIPMSLSSPSHPNYPFYKSRLSPGWILGRPIDNSDAQYRSFRSNLTYLSIAALAYLFTKFLRVHYFINSTMDPFFLVPFNVGCSILMIGVLHGSSAFKVFIILTTNYAIAKRCRGSKLGPMLTWVFNGAVLFANETYHGYSFGVIHPSLAYLDTYRGMYPRWHVIFNITMLRLISFNMDYYWACNLPHPSENVYTPNDKQRQTLPHEKYMYSFMNYLAYILYPPLYIAGPIMTFNDFIWQIRHPLDIPLPSIRSYIIRFIFCFLTMECVLHFMYVVAIKDRKAWVGDTPAQISMIGLWNLITVWLKLLIPWRFFRLWALMDGVVAPENMVRCMANNYSTLGFWRSWHRSYNLWIIRYIYIPLGGSKNVILNTVLVFSFVALWHDLTFRLLAWGWLVSLFILPELIATYLLPKTKFGEKPWYRHVCAVGAVLNMLMMVVANLVGFVIGTDGIKFFLSQMFGTVEGIRFILGASICLFVGAQLMFEYREEEMRHGIYRRC